MWLGICCGVFLEIRRQILVIGFLLSPNEIQGSNSVHQTWPVGHSVCIL